MAANKRVFIELKIWNTRDESWSRKANLNLEKKGEKED
jgi:hypothetical protein